MEIRTLPCFPAVAREENMSRAAERLQSEHFGAVFPPDSPLAGKNQIIAENLAGPPLFTSSQACDRAFASRRVCGIMKIEERLDK